MNRIFIFLFILFLTVPTVAGLLGVEPKSIENRALAAPPDLSMAEVFSGNYFEEAGDYMRDHLPLRIEAVRLHNWILFQINPGSVSPRVYQGRGRDLFLDVEIDNPCQRAVGADDIVSMIEDFQSAVRRDGQDFYFVFMPNKAFSYPNRMTPALAQKEACAAERRAGLRLEIGANQNVSFIDLWTPVEEHVRAGGEILFPEMGRHATTFAGAFFAELILEGVSPSLWDPGALRAGNEYTVNRELPFRFMGMSLPETRVQYRVERGLNAPMAREGFRLSASSARESFRYSSEGFDAGLVPGRTIVFHDSFMDPSRDLLAAYFEDIYFIHWGEFMSQPDAVRPLLASADNVIFAYVEDLKEESVPNTVGRSALLSAYVE